MIIEALTLENFGTYAGRQHLALRTEPERPLIILVGLNGAGKTTILDALLLALYGKRARCSSRKDLAYDEFLRRTVHRGAAADATTSVALTISRREAGRDERIQVQRSWRRDGNERIKVSIDGLDDALASEHWDELVERLLPAAIANLFFFDGEQIEQLADIEHARTILNAAITGLLGLDLVDRLNLDLQTLQRRKAATVDIGDLQPRLEAARTRVGATEEERSVAAATCAELQSRIDWLTKEHVRVRASFQARGGQHYLDRETLREEERALEAESRTCEKELQLLAAGALPLGFIEPLIERAQATAQREQQSFEARRFLKVLADRDRKIIDGLRADGVPEKHLTLLRDRFEIDRGRRRENAAQRAVLRVDDATLDQLSHVPTLLRAERRDADRLLRRNANVERRLLDVRRRLNSVPDDATIVPLIEEVKKLEDAIQLTTREHAAATERYARACRDATTASDHYDTLTRQVGEHEIVRQDEARLLRYATRVRETMTAFRAKVLTAHLSRISQLVLESFRVLARKEGLVESLRINELTLAIELFDAEQRRVDTERLSAGERQLLATALLWGLARASQRPLPMVIDTPLGRLDSTHRERLLTNYFPHASHQVILLATDEEISSQEVLLLRPFVTAARILTYDDSTGATVVGNEGLAHVS
jgi:DNA sulfur modification protein DndD